MLKVFSSSFWILVFSIILFCSCSNTKFLTNDQVLYVGLAKTEITDKKNLKKSKAAATKIEEITHAKPNNAFLGTRRVIPPLGLWTYNYFKPKKKKPEGGWVYRNFSKEPILISTVNPDTRVQKLETAMFSYGFFHAKAKYEVRPKKKNPKKAKIKYTITLGEPFIINKIIKPAPVDSIDIFLNNYLEDFKLNPGDVFNLDIIKEEKLKMVSGLVEQGYYFFGPDNIEIIADTVAVPHQINLLIRKLEPVPEFILKKYTIDDITVTFKDFAEDTSATNKGLNDSLIYEGVTIVGLRNYLTPETIHHCIQFEKGALYSAARHQGTLKQLNNLGVFRNVRVQYALIDTASQKLDMKIELTPKDNVNLNLEGYVQGKSTGFAGPGLEATISNNNIAKSAYTLQLKVTGGFEWQIAQNTDEVLGTNSYNAGMNTAFAFPKLMLPFHIKGEKNLLFSKTIIDLGFEFLNNVRYYRMTSLTTGFKYQWRKVPKITHSFSPAKVNIVNLLETTTEFDSIVESNIYVKKSFEEQTILGMEYGFVFDNSLRKRNGFYFQSILGTSGNVASLVSAISNNNKPYKLLGNVYSQFLKASVDIRYYNKTTKKGFALRLYSGVGYSYGNSTVMPYIEQFYSGGSSSIRAFSARSLGPGSYKPEEINGIIDQTGDIKLEFNAEYRVPASDMVHTALFLDVGNVWLLNEDVNRPGAEFNFDTFSNQLAVGAGVGLRFDFDFFILRTDVGFPLRNTYESDYGYWIPKSSEILSDYRLNIAIGFPY